MPRFGFAYSIDSKTVLRGGYGMFYDTLNASHTFINQFGYNQATSTNVTNESGASWNFGYFSSPGRQPADRSVSGALERHPLRCAVRQQPGYSTPSPAEASPSSIRTSSRRSLIKLRVELERQVLKNLVIGVSYNLGYTPNLGVTRDLNALARAILGQRAWRAIQPIENELNRNVNNPFRLANFASLQQSNPLLYQQMSTLGFFTGARRPEESASASLSAHDGSYARRRRRSARTSTTR